jgi:type II secretory pathway pseudopilin PulG
MKTKKSKNFRVTLPRRPRSYSEKSFSLIETVIALAIVAFLIVEVAAVQGNSIVFSEYGRNITQASWLAKRVLSQVEYYWLTKKFKDLEQEVKDTKFEDFDEYSYSLEIKEWKFPFVQMLTQALGGGGGDDGDDDKGKAEDGGMTQMLDTIVKQVFGDEPQFMTAHVDVSWAEGAQRNSVGMTYLLTNQAKIDEAVANLKTTYDKVTRPEPPKHGQAQPPGKPPGKPPDQQSSQPPVDGDEGG